MRRLTSLLAALSLAGSLAAAQSNPSSEVGTLVGVTILSRSGNSVTHFGIPGDGIQASPILYATFFVTPSVMVEPQVAFTYLSSNGSHLTALAIAGQFGYLFSPGKSGSPYVAANLAFQSLSNGSSVSGPGAGAAVGYRFKVKNSLAIRLDARYRLWFSDFKDLNEIGFGLGLGATF
jgi:hypothetical protein